MRLADYLDAIYFILSIHNLRKLYYKYKNIAIARFLVMHDLPIGSAVKFENNIKLLKRYTNIISLDDFMAGKMNFGQINTVITFDDGYKTWINIVLPVLKKHDIKATFFISSGFVKKQESSSTIIRTKTRNNNPNFPNSRPYISTEEIIRIKNAHHIIGGHTINHVSLLKEKNIGVIEREILEDKKILEEITGTKIKYFAFPYGHVKYDHDIEHIFLSSGYEAAVTLNPGFNSKYTNVYLLHRDIVRGNMGYISFLTISVGNRDVGLFIRGLFKKIYNIKFV